MSAMSLIARTGQTRGLSRAKRRLSWPSRPCSCPPPHSSVFSSTQTRNRCHPSARRADNCTACLAIQPASTSRRRRLTPARCLIACHVCGRRRALVPHPASPRHAHPCAASAMLPFWCSQWLKWFCEAGGGAHLTKPGWSKPHTHSNPTYLALFRHKITLYRFKEGGSYYCRGLKWEQDGWAPPDSPSL